MRRAVLSLAGLLLLILAVTRFYPTIETLTVRGAAHYSAAEVLEKANLELGAPLLWVTRWQVGALARDPWIGRATVTRVWPDAVVVELTERTPAAAEGATVYAADGTVLPGATLPDSSPALAGGSAESLVTLRGWGPARTAEALELLRLVSAFEPEVISYSPSGFTVTFAQTTLYTPDAATLRANWSGFLGQRESSVAVYPWGVSVQP